jgi:hypothetical protein
MLEAILRQGTAKRTSVLGAACLLAAAGAPDASALSVVENNKIVNPPLYPGAATTCTATLRFKPVPFTTKQHSFIVVRGPDGRMLELRAGPAKGGPAGTIVPGQSGASSGDQPSGNLFSCGSINDWGAVVHYVGAHGLLGSNAQGQQVFSPDGDVASPTATVQLGRGGQPDICKMANCVMTVMTAQARSCKPYMALGVAVTRNSNTAVSMALAACGVADPKPAAVDAPGWGAPWE